MKYALIGCGRIAANHIRAAVGNGLEVVALCDVDESKFDALIERAGCGSFPGVARYSDYRLMLEEHPEVELVAIATESGEHARIALDCIDAGKHLVVEKPIALTMADADEIVRRAAERGVKVSTCHQNRFNEAIRELRRALDGGRFGRLSHGSVHVRWNRDRVYYDLAPWRGTWAQDGGALMNQCIHGIDLLRWTMGDDPVEVYGATRRRLHGYIEGEDLGVAIVKFASGALATVEGTVNVFPRNLEESLCVFGERGTVVIGGASANRIDAWDFADGFAFDVAAEEASHAEMAGSLAASEVPSGGQARSNVFAHRVAGSASDVYGNGHMALYADTVDAIQSDRVPYVDAVAGRNAVELVLAIYKSQKTGLPVRLPLEGFGCADMEGEF